MKYFSEGIEPIYGGEFKNNIIAYRWSWTKGSIK